MVDNKKWAEKLRTNCGLSAEALEFALEELSESCYGDSLNSKKVIEELTKSCHFSEAELRKFVESVSKNCPIDIKKLHEEIVEAEGKKELAFAAIGRVRTPV